MSREQDHVQPRPLDAAKLEALALRYVGRYATTRAKLRAYLQRKLGERGWSGDAPPPVERLIERFAEFRYVDDRAFAEMKSAALVRRGFGKRRVDAALRVAGVTADDAAPATESAGEQGEQSALTLARRRRIGPFAAEPADPAGQRRALAILLRAGHDYALARYILSLAPEEIADPSEL